MKDELIIGIDPGTRVTGYGLIRRSLGKIKAVDFGCIRPPPTLLLSKRYRILFDGIGKLLDHFSPDALAVETQYVDKNVQSTLKLGMARGVIILAAALRDIPVFEYSPSRAKRAIVGKGNATKAQIQAMLKHLLALSSEPEPEDAADALALAICHAHVIIQKKEV